ncbi:putative uncharacterized protein FLJ40606 [Elephas maximus indicus]|uniref:putative uncharacterized protein FLJ40606 n=1 Tax=Elephas maximus indicus TaxID=99487 RepID=UPI0021166722|nr:putative uncharacterized protein FLJ40606 [Elephas maximus indicus]
MVAAAPAAPAAASSLASSASLTPERRERRRRQRRRRLRRGPTSPWLPGFSRGKRSLAVPPPPPPPPRSPLHARHLVTRFSLPFSSSSSSLVRAVLAGATAADASNARSVRVCTRSPGRRCSALSRGGIRDRGGRA